MAKPADDTALSNATEQLIEETITDGAQPPVTDKEPDPAPTPVVEESDDDREYREAHEALKAEQNPPKEPVKPTEVASEKEPLPKTDAQAPVKADEPPADDKKQPIMIPKARLDEVLRRNEELAHTASYYKGLADANKERSSVAQPDQSKPAEPVKTIKELLTEIDTQQLELAKKYDDGELTAAQWTAERLKLENQAATIRIEEVRIEGERLRNETKAEARKEAMELSLEEHAAKLDKGHPGLTLMPADDNHPMWGLLAEKAKEKLAADGVTLVKGDARSTMIWRETLAELADKYAPIWTEKPLPGKASTPPTPPPGDKKPSLADKRLEKIQLSHQQPPDSSKLGSSGVRPELTEAQILAMSDDDLASLPEATRARIKGLAA